MLKLFLLDGGGLFFENMAQNLETQNLWLMCLMISKGESKPHVFSPFFGDSAKQSAASHKCHSKNLVRLMVFGQIP